MSRHKKNRAEILAKLKRKELDRDTLYELMSRQKMFSPKWSEYRSRYNLICSDIYMLNRRLEFVKQGLGYLGGKVMEVAIPSTNK